MNSENAMATIADRVRRARKDAGLSQDELALLAGMSRRPLYLLEAGKGAIRVDNLIRILDALGLQLEVKPRGAMSADGS